MRRDEQAILWLLDPGKTKRHEGELVLLLRRNFPWIQFCDTVLAQGIAPFVLFQMRRHELIDLLPTWAYLRLRDRYDWTAMRNGVILRDLIQVTAEFSRQAVQWMPVGTTFLLARGIFPDRGLREITAATLALAPATEPTALKSLARLGYRTLESGGHVEWVNERGTGLYLAPDATAGRLTRAQQIVLAVTTAQSQFQDGALSAFIDLWALAAAQAGSAGTRMAMPRLTPGHLKRAMRLPLQRQTVFHRLTAAFGRLFPARAEMLRRHGRGAVGFGLYKLYASRLFASTSARLSAVRGTEAQVPNR